jgi:DNA-binding transcriptional ArsR family regulator
MIVSHMAKHDPNLDRLFHALSDATRRSIVERLTAGPASVSDLAAPTGMALPTVMKHISVLEASGLLVTEKSGRVRICRASPAPLAAAQTWIEAQRADWEARLDRLDDYVTRLHKDRSDELGPKD